MLDKVQKFIDSRISSITTINKRWIDVFLPNTKNTKNEALVRLLDTNEFTTLCNDILYTTYNFEVYVIGNENLTESRNLIENLYNNFNSTELNNFEYENINIGWCKARNMSFQFLENDQVSVNKFNLELMVEKNI